MLKAGDFVKNGHMSGIILGIKGNNALIARQKSGGYKTIEFIIARYAEVSEVQNDTEFINIHWSSGSYYSTLTDAVNEFY